MAQTLDKLQTCHCVIFLLFYDLIFFLFYCFFGYLVAQADNIVYSDADKYPSPWETHTQKQVIKEGERTHKFLLTYYLMCYLGTHNTQDSYYSMLNLGTLQYPSFTQVSIICYKFECWRIHDIPLRHHGKVMKFSFKWTS